MIALNSSTYLPKLFGGEDEPMHERFSCEKAGEKVNIFKETLRNVVPTEKGYKSN